MKLEISQVYNADWPFNTVFSAHHRGNNAFLNWKYTQLSQFSPCDTQLLVSGRCDVSEQSGEIVIYNIYAGIFSIQVDIIFHLRDKDFLKLASIKSSYIFRVIGRLLCNGLAEVVFWFISPAGWRDFTK